MVDLTDAELDRLVERLERGGFHPYEGRHIPDDLTDEAAAAITALRSRTETLEAAAIPPKPAQTN